MAQPELEQIQSSNVFVYLFVLFCCISFKQWVISQLAESELFVY